MDSPLSIRSIVSASPDQISCPLGEESAILNLRNTVYYGLDPVGARVWNMLQQPKSVEELRDTLVNEYDVVREHCERDLLDLLEKLLGEGLIEVRNTSAP